ncbi:MAG: flagellar export protein FliJ [Spirochaetes bacterium]|nr:flagellar export protein FliJ [Spirochaetota bacterium]
MRNFAFKLEKLLEIRGYAEKQKVLELAEVTGRYMQIVSSIEDLKNRKRKIMESRFEAAGNNVYSIMYDESLISAIDVKVMDFEKKLIPLNIEKENKRLEYLEALKNKRVLEKLREKKAEMHKKSELIRGSKAIDDIVSSNFIKLQEVKI